MEKFGVSLFGAKWTSGTRNKNREKNIRRRKAQRSKRASGRRKARKEGSERGEYTQRNTGQDNTALLSTAKRNVVRIQQASTGAQEQTNKSTNQHRNK